MTNFEIDFSTLQFRCSSLDKLKYAKGRDPRKVLVELEDQYTDVITEWSEIEDKTSKAAKALVEKANKLLDKIALTKPKCRVPHLSQTTKTYLADKYTVLTTGRTEDIVSKYMEKGLHSEEAAITQYSIATGKFFKKNTEEKSNEYITGSLDFNEPGIIYDTKVNWSVFQFNRVAARVNRKDYKNQMQGYMRLWNESRHELDVTEINKARLVYSLINTPEHLLKREEKYLMFNYIGTEEDYKNACEDLRLLHTYDDFPPERRIRTYDYERDDSAMEEIYELIRYSREWLQLFHENKHETDADETED